MAGRRTTLEYEEGKLRIKNISVFRLCFTVAVNASRGVLCATTAYGSLVTHWSWKTFS